MKATRIDLGVPLGYCGCVLNQLVRATSSGSLPALPVAALLAPAAFSASGVSILAVNCFERWNGISRRLA